MFAIETCTLPDNALLEVYQRNGAFTDCYFVDIAVEISHRQYVEAFYTTWLFKLERILLTWLVSKPSTDEQVVQLATAQIDVFAAWRVERRCDKQILLYDYQNRTRSWLMIESIESEKGKFTRLYFGSAVVPVNTNSAGEASFVFAFKALSWFHKVYSAGLLRAATSRIMRINNEISL